MIDISCTHKGHKEQRSKYKSHIAKVNKVIAREETVSSMYK